MGGRSFFEGTFTVGLDWGPEQTWIHVPPAFHTTDAHTIAPILSLWAALCQLHHCYDDASLSET